MFSFLRVIVSSLPQYKGKFLSIALYRVLWTTRDYRPVHSNAVSTALESIRARGNLFMMAIPKQMSVNVCSQVLSKTAE